MWKLALAVRHLGLLIPLKTPVGNTPTPETPSAALLTPLPAQTAELEIYGTLESPVSIALPLLLEFPKVSKVSSGSVKSYKQMPTSVLRNRGLLPIEL